MNVDYMPSFKTSLIVEQFQGNYFKQFPSSITLKQGTDHEGP